MNNKIKTSYKLLLTTVILSTLTACGSGGGADTSVVTGTPSLNGIVVNNSNYESAFRTGVTGSFKLALQLMFAGNKINTSRLILSSNTTSTFSYACDNQGGTFQVTDLGNNTEEWVFSDCEIAEVSPATHYQGIFTIEHITNSGEEADVGSQLHNWNVTQNIVYNDFIQTYPSVNGPSSRANGNVVLDSSNNLTSRVNRTAMRSSNLTIDSTSVADVTTTYAFSDIYYDLQDNLDTDYLQSDIDFTANITGIGDAELMTSSPLQFDDVGVLLSGTGIVDTGSSKARMVATGGDNVEISLDPENDGTYESPISTTWSAIGGGESL